MSNKSLVSEPVLNDLNKVHKMDERFDPYEAIKHIYDHYMVRGSGSVITIMGWTPKFVNDSISSWHKMLVDTNRASSDNVPLPLHGRHITDKGIVVQFLLCEDSYSQLDKFRSAVTTSDYVCLFSDYGDPAFKGILRTEESQRIISSFTKNMK